ncbi:class I SAM-dependent methyltransferase [Marinactinospora thermotolerans]|uniref:O-Methyltransferase involved in polyketide biosynthesis n=1 Tax=Marinactinospora thermotolerans DSM 45154 TaxID=1122192 RepID=A0A1T4NMG2_9ACTN|nr:class I SAM-dependent methyltransferase [Marinactinospora thermotolerans]SJZ80511.1 O-Methyltransferase involved in polyketide biosynthesis [Marinactinospora thermotolerans DSM 45154]
MTEPPSDRYGLAHLSPVERTLVVTLIGRARDERRSVPFLGDPVPAALLERLDVDPGRVGVGGTVALATALRSVMLDRAVRSFLATHRDAVVVELGAGLETRRHRIRPGSEVDWYDVELPAAAELRRALLPPEPLSPEGARAHLVAADVTAAGWLAGLPRNRPTIVVADGLVGLLPPDGARAMLTALAGHFHDGELVFNAYPRLVARTVGAQPMMRRLGIPRGYRGFGFDQPRAVEALAPGLVFVDERFGVQERVGALSPPLRITAALFARWPAQARRGVWVVRYRFAGPHRERPGAEGRPGWPRNGAPRGPCPGPARWRARGRAGRGRCLLRPPATRPAGAGR